MDATCAWARADTTWWVGLTEVDATWTRGGTTWWEGLAEVDATWTHAGTTWWEGLAEVDATWTRAGTTWGGGAGLIEVDATGDDVLAQGSPVTHISIMFWNLHKSLDQCQAYCIPNISKVHSIK